MDEGDAAVRRSHRKRKGNPVSEPGYALHIGLALGPMGRRIGAAGIEKGRVYCHLMKATRFEFTRRIEDVPRHHPYPVLETVAGRVFLPQRRKFHAGFQPSHGDAVHPPRQTQRHRPHSATGVEHGLTGMRRHRSGQEYRINGRAIAVHGLAQNHRTVEQGVLAYLFCF